MTEPASEPRSEPPESATPTQESAPVQPEQLQQFQQPEQPEQLEAAEPPGPGRLHRFRIAFRAWRRSRPFWGGLLVLLGGGEILLTYRAAFGIVLHFGLYGLAGYLVPSMLVLLGALIMFDPAHRTFYSVLAVLAALGSWLTSNLGGFFLGMLLGLIGGSMAFGWQYGERPARNKRQRQRRRARSSTSTRARARAAE